MSRKLQIWRPGCCRSWSVDFFTWFMTYDIYSIMGGFGMFFGGSLGGACASTGRAHYVSVAPDPQNWTFLLMEEMLHQLRSKTSNIVRYVCIYCHAVFLPSTVISPSFGNGNGWFRSGVDNTKKNKYEYHVLQVYHSLPRLSSTTPSMESCNHLFILSPARASQAERWNAIEVTDCDWVVWDLIIALRPEPLESFAIPVRLMKIVSLKMIWRVLLGTPERVHCGWLCGFTTLFKMDLWNMRSPRYEDYNRRSTALTMAVRMLWAMAFTHDGNWQIWNQYKQVVIFKISSHHL